MHFVVLSLTVLLPGQATQPASQPAVVPEIRVMLPGVAVDASRVVVSVPTTLPLSAHFSGKVEPVTDSEFEQLLERLKHPRFRDRQEAIERLRKVRGERLPALVARYRSESSFEVKRALRGVIEHLFYRREIIGERGFLGIRPTPVDGVVDPATGESVEAMHVGTVIEGHAADQAGMKVGDLIVSYDGQAMGAIYKVPLPDRPDIEKLAKQRGRPLRSEDRRVDTFTQKVKTTEPGRDVPVRVLRPVPTSIELVGEPSADDRAFLKGLRYVGSKEGFIVHEVDPNSPGEAMGLKAGDVIVKVNGQSISSQKQDKPIEEAVAQVKPLESLVLSVNRSVLKEVDLKVVLGTRPMNMINPTDELVLKDRFARWWLEQEGEMVYTPSRPNTGWIYTQTTTQPVPETDLLP